MRIALDLAMHPATDLSVADEVREAAESGNEELRRSPRSDWFVRHRLARLAREAQHACNGRPAGCVGGRNASTSRERLTPAPCGVADPLSGDPLRRDSAVDVARSASWPLVDRQGEAFGPR